MSACCKDSTALPGRLSELDPILSWFPWSPGRIGLCWKLLRRELLESRTCHRGHSVENEGAWGQSSVASCCQEHQNPQTILSPPQAEAPRWRPRSQQEVPCLEPPRPRVRRFYSHRQMHLASTLVLAGFCLWAPLPCTGQFCIQSCCSVPCSLFCLPSYVSHFPRQRR